MKPEVAGIRQRINRSEPSAVTLESGADQSKMSAAWHFVDVDLLKVNAGRHYATAGLH